MIRVLHFVSTPAIASGVMSVIMNYYRNVDRDRVQFDFLCFEPCAESYEAEIAALGGRIFWIPKPGVSFKSITELAGFFKEHGRDYTWLHNHEVYLSFLLKPLADRYKIPNFIVHCHATRYSDRKLAAVRNRILCFPIRFLTCYRFACSKAAGRFLYGGYQEKRPVFLLPNAIDRERFSFCEDVREDMRKNLGLEDSFVIGHIGRFAPQKNHVFLLEVFKRVQEEWKEARLMLIGDGALRQEIETWVKEQGLSDHVLFLGQRTDIPGLLSAMDLFVLPSLYEGLPVSCLEAQAAGLACLAADTVSEEAKYREDFAFLPIKDPKDAIPAEGKERAEAESEDHPECLAHAEGQRSAKVLWTKAILERIRKTQAANSLKNRICPSELPDIHAEAKKLTDFYEMRKNNLESIL